MVSDKINIYRRTKLTFLKRYLNDIGYRDFCLKKFVFSQA